MNPNSTPKKQSKSQFRLPFQKKIVAATGTSLGFRP